jgi:ferredoxin
MGTGPSAGTGYDLALTELVESEHRFYAQVGSAAGAEVLAQVSHRPVTTDDRSARQAVLARAEAQMGRSLDTEGLPGLLARNLEHPRWEEVAERCLSCGNCTLVCPTCFCSDIKDVSDISGAVERQRRWASCFDLEHSYLHGGPVRPTTASRYRQWLTHKLSTWWDQFGESGCVGCGRCIAWCPVSIDLTEEAAAIRATDGAVAAGEGRTS